MGSSYSAIELRPLLAEREGFEPPIPLRVCMISSHVHSTRLCHLSPRNRRVRYQIASAKSSECRLFFTRRVHRDFSAKTSRHPLDLRRILWYSIEHESRTAPKGRNTWGTREHPVRGSGENLRKPQETCGRNGCRLPQPPVVAGRQEPRRAHTGGPPCRVRRGRKGRKAGEGTARGALPARRRSRPLGGVDLKKKSARYASRAGRSSRR